VLAGVVATVVSGAVLAVSRRIAAERKRVTASIDLRVSARVMADERLRFGLLHVRDGREQEGGSEPINKTQWFEIQSGSVGSADLVTLTATTRYRRALGLQFKCFVDHKGAEFESVSEILAHEAAIREITRSARPHRASFLLASYPTTSDRGFTNNFLFPV
jgi:exoribonuclease II